MRIFPKSINEKIWKEHLLDYSRTLMDFIPIAKQIIPIEHHKFIPYGLYICPICIKNYFVATDVGIVGNAEFSIDHLPPQSAGGTYKMITCKKCNNDSGIYESELEKLLNFGIDKANPNSGTIFKVQVRDPATGQVIKGTLKNNNGISDIIFDENLKKYRNDYIDFLNRLHTKKMGTISVEVPLYDKKKLSRALIKSAYLICFYWWGYEFVFSENGSLIRDVIAGKRDYPCTVPISWGDKNKAVRTGVSILLDGDERKAFLVNIKLSGIDTNTTASILIPSPTKDCWENIALINEIGNGTNIKEFNGIEIPRILHPAGYTISWLLILNKSSNSI